MTKSALHVFVHDRDEPVYHTKEDFLPCVGYYLNGIMAAAPVDTLFDSYIFLPSFDFHHVGGLDDEFAGCRPINRQMLEQFYEAEFQRHYNLGALNAAVAEVKKALNQPNYKVEVYLPILTPIPTIGTFGRVKNQILDLRSEEDRLAVVEWQVDEQIWHMRKSGFEHIKLVGFYYVTERLLQETDMIVPLLRHFNKYVCSRGYISHWNPVNHWHTDYFRWKELGFQSCSQQMRHIPFMQGEQPRRCAQGQATLQEFAKLTELYGIGVTLEWCNLSGNNQEWKYFKKCLEGGVKYGYMLRPPTFFRLGDGPRSVRAVASGLPYSRQLREGESEKERCQMDVPVIRSLYRELYMFIKGTLTEKEIFWG